MAIKHVTDADWHTQLSKEGVTLVDFGASWCAPCRTLLPILEQLDHDYAQELTVLKLDVDESPSTASSFGVMSMPTVIVFRNGEPVERLIGLRPHAVYKQTVEKHLG